MKWKAHTRYDGQRVEEVDQIINDDDVMRFIVRSPEKIEGLQPASRIEIILEKVV